MSCAVLALNFACYTDGTFAAKLAVIGQESFFFCICIKAMKKRKKEKQMKK